MPTMLQPMTWITAIVRDAVFETGPDVQRFMDVLTPAYNDVVTRLQEKRDEHRPYVALVTGDDYAHDCPLFSWLQSRNAGWTQRPRERRRQ